MKKMAASIRRVGLVANTEKPRTAALVRQAAQILRHLGTPCLIHQPYYNMFGRTIEDGLTGVLEEEGIPRDFEFKGAVVFITNTDFESEIQKDSKMSPHYRALMSRCLYVDLRIHTKREILVRIAQVVFSKEFLRENGVTKAQAQEMMRWLTEHLGMIRVLSIRTVLQLASMVKTDEDWKDMAEVTMLGRRS